MLLPIIWPSLNRPIAYASTGLNSCLSKSAWFGSSKFMTSYFLVLVAGESVGEIVEDLIATSRGYFFFLVNIFDSETFLSSCEIVAKSCDKF